MPGQILIDEDQEITESSREEELQRALETATRIARRQQLLKELWKLGRKQCADETVSVTHTEA